MLTRVLPERIDHRKLVNDGAILQGIIPLNRFARLTQSLEGNEGILHARLEFRRGSKHRTLVVGKANVDVRLTCQSCLDSIVTTLGIDVRLTLVNSDSELLELELGEDGIVVESNLATLVDFYEDELILNLPMVARHEDGKCQDVCNDEYLSKSVNKNVNEDVSAIAGEIAGEIADRNVESIDTSSERVRPFAALSEMLGKANTKH